MKKSKFTEQQIDRVCASASGDGTNVTHVCRKMGISEATFNQLYGGLIPSEVKKLRHLEEQNAAA